MTVNVKAASGVNRNGLNENLIAGGDVRAFSDNNYAKNLNILQTRQNIKRLGFDAEFTQLEKRIRHSIFRGLIALLRSEDFSRNTTLTEYLKITFQTPDFSRSGNFGMLDSDDLYQLGIVLIPNTVLNLIVCSRLAKVYGDDLSLCNGFLKVGENWQLDVSENLSRRGVFLPLRDRNNLIYGLKVYRFPDDQKPFFLKVRRAA